MNNRFRNEILDEEIERENELVPEGRGEPSKNFRAVFFADGGLSKEAASAMLPFMFYMAVLGMVYIGNRHFAEKNIRKIDKLSKEVKELSWDYKTLKADLMLKSTQTEVAKRVDTLGLEEPVEPPKKIVVESVVNK